MSTALNIPRTTTTALDAPSVDVENTVLADLLDAIETYPQTHLSVDIYDVETDGTAINEGDEVTFRVHVHNSGPLNVKDLTLLVEARSGATGVKLHGGTAFNPSSLTSAVFPQVPAHQQDGDFVETPDDHYHFEAGAPSDTPVEMVKVSIKDWNADLDHILLAHSDPVPAADDVYSHKILRK